MSKQLTLKRTLGWGGRRKNAGRPNKTHTVNHMKRENINARYPLHITMRLQDKMPNLRQWRLHKEFQKCVRLAGRLGFKVIQYSLQTNHIHMIVETQNNTALARGAQSLASRFAKIIRKLKHGRGSVFAGRYHVRALKTPTEMKRALEYVLLNTAKHLKRIEHIDPFSSGAHFDRWPKLLGRRFASLIENEVLLLQDARPKVKDVFSPRTWLAQIGWIRAK